MLLRCIINAFINEEKVLLRQRDVGIKRNVEWGVEVCFDIRNIIVSFSGI